MKKLIPPRRPPRLTHVFSAYNPPLYFVTLTTRERRPLLARQEVNETFCHYGRDNLAVGRAIGRYVIMPDHIHFFVRLGVEDRLTVFVQLLKQRITRVLKSCGEVSPFWQSGFFDHLIRSSDSYGEKWTYVRENPVRAGLVAKWEDWPYQGEVVRIDRA